MVLHKHVAYRSFLEVVTLRITFHVITFGSAWPILSLIKQDPVILKINKRKELQNGHLNAYDSFQN